MKEQSRKKQNEHTASITDNEQQSNDTPPVDHANSSAQNSVGQEKKTKNNATEEGITPQAKTQEPQTAPTPDNTKQKNSVYTHSAKRLENARVELSITVPKKIVAETMQKTFKELEKNTQIKGFRKGHVPRNVLISKFDSYIQAKCIDTLMNTAFSAIISELEFAPFPYSTPTPKGIDQNSRVNADEDFTFSLQYDTFPTIELSSLDSVELKQYSITLDEEDIEAELHALQERNALYLEKDGESANGDLITFSYVELDEHQQAIEQTRHDNHTGTVGMLQTIYELNEELLGLSKNKEALITKTFAAEHDNRELAGRTITLKLEPSKLQQKKVPEIDDELAKDINEKYQTLDELKEDIKTELVHKAEEIQFAMHQRKILTHYLAHSKIEVPEAAVQAQLESLFQQFAKQTGQAGAQSSTIPQALLEKKEELFKYWYDDAAVQVKEQFLISKAIEQEKIQSSIEEAEDKIRQEIEKKGQNADEMLTHYREKQLLPQVQYELNIRKLFDALIQKCKIKKESDVSFRKLLEIKEKEEKKEYNG